MVTRFSSTENRFRAANIKPGHMRDIYLPELIEIKIKNFSLYPNALDFSYDFVNGVNLVLAGNGMGKTTFVNLIKYAITGGYNSPYDLRRTYLGSAIERRGHYSKDYFKNRMDSSVAISGDAIVIIRFKVAHVVFQVERGLNTLSIEKIFVDGVELKGAQVDFAKYEFLSPEEKEKCLQYKYEKEFERYSNISFDDLIFFVHIVLFFGEDHKTILWHTANSESNKLDVQQGLFNRYFNSPELNNEREESLRKAKYLNSLARHKSEDIRAIRKVLDGANKNKSEASGNVQDILSIKSNIEHVDNVLNDTHSRRKSLEFKSSEIQNEINKISVSINALENEKNQVEEKIRRLSWEMMHPSYDAFIENIIHNHLCPMCNKPSESIHEKVINNQEQCFVCGTIFDEIKDTELSAKYEDISLAYRELSQRLKTYQSELSSIDRQINLCDQEFSQLEGRKRSLMSKLRGLEFNNSKNDYPSDLQIFYDEITNLESEKNKFLEESRKELDKAEIISKKIEEIIIANTTKFSALFSSYAEKFLGVRCSLTYDIIEGNNQNRFYPVIDNKVRTNPEELSESQRFFVDHSFRMSILSFFYKTPTFYIVETPDSSLDLSYERNAAMVFLNFLKNPNALIITSNLNNSNFVNYLIDNDSDVKVSIVAILEMARKSHVQSESSLLLSQYKKIRSKLSGDHE